MNEDSNPENEAQIINGEVISDKKISLPEVGTRFYISGQLYKVVYINLGRKRFSAEIAKS